jgi:phosphatidylinositol 4-kinase
LSDIEFYLPQLVHLVIHLSADYKKKTLEILCNLICQSSIHIAFQFCFILTAYMEDFQPEDNNGVVNSNSSPRLFFRCARLLINVHRTVVFGSPVLSIDDEKKIAIQMKIANESELNYKDFSKQQLAIKIVRTNGLDNPTPPDFSGNLFYKRTERKSKYSTKPWKMRYFLIKQKVLFCYKCNLELNQIKEVDDALEKGKVHSIGLPIRTISLRDCKMEILNGKYQYHFVITNKTNGVQFFLRALNEKDYNSWMTIIQREINDSPPQSYLLSTDPIKESNYGEVKKHVSMRKVVEQISIDQTKLTSAQRKRHNYFVQQREFINNLTEIADRLRYVDKSLRKYFLRRDLESLVIPTFCYLPLCKSTDTFNYILRTLPYEGRAFTTKARCPTLIYFEMEKHPFETDFATFIGSELHQFNENDLILPSNKIVESDLYVDCKTDLDINEIDEEADAKAYEASLVKTNEKNLSIFSNYTLDTSKSSTFWKEEGLAMDILESKLGTKLCDNNLSSSVFHSSTGTYSCKPLFTKETVKSNNNDISVIGGISFEKKAEKIRNSSSYGHLSGWNLGGLIAKSNDDVRQEVFVMRLIEYYQRCFRFAKVPVFLHTYEIISISKTTGLIQLIPNAISLDELKKQENFAGSLRKHFEKIYGYIEGKPEPPAFSNAINEYLKSLAAYSIVSYLLDIKDRHNGNVMIDSAGHLIHIDFGFVFGLAPGKQMSMEKAPFKLTIEMLDVIGGKKSPQFSEYVKLCTHCLMIARENVDDVITLFEIMSYESLFPSFRFVL